MVTNLPPQAAAQYKKVVESRTPEERILNLKVYLSLIPRHKGTEKLQRQVRRQISELEAEVRERKQRRRKARKAHQDLETDEDSPLIVFIGRTSSGKSTLLSSLTSARPNITGLPYTTQRPKVGGYRFGSVVFQLVELPAIRPSSPMVASCSDILRRSDLVALVIDLTQGIEGQMRIIEELRQLGIYLGMPSGAVKVERRDAGGISVIGSSPLITREELLVALRAEGIDSAVVRFGPHSTLHDLRAAARGIFIKPMLIIANKVDAPGGAKAYDRLTTSLRGTYDSMMVSALNGTQLDGMGRAFLSTMGAIRVFTKPPSESEPSAKPILLRQGASMTELAETIHKELARKLKYARVWRPGKGIDGIRVGPNFVLEDMDAVELHG